MPAAATTTTDDEVHQSSPRMQRKTFAFLPIDAHGHLNAMIGLADQLRSRGHRTVFICNDSRTAKHFGHELILVRESAADASSAADKQKHASNDEDEAIGEEQIFIGDQKLNSKWSQMVDLLDLNVNKPECVVKSLTHNYSLLKLTIEQEIIPSDERIERILIDLQADLVVVDQLTPIPAIHRLSSSSSSSSPLSVASEASTSSSAASGIGGVDGIGIGQRQTRWSSSIDSSKQQQQQQVVDKKPFRWISLCSANPMPLYHDHSLPNQFPPPLMGLSLNRMESGVSLEVQQLRYERILKSSGILEALARLASLVSPELLQPSGEQQFRRFCRNESPWLNLYMCPAELDYAGERGLANLPSDRYHRVDCLIRAPKPLTSQEEDLLGRVEKWRKLCAGQKEEATTTACVVYVSMGTTMSFNLKLMESLLEQVFACLGADKTKAGVPSPNWRFAIALGPRAELLSCDIRAKLQKWQQADRVVAAKWWPQPELMRRKLVDVCLLHGGNNTICELFHFGVKSLIVVPAFHDQLDNARRVADLGLGVSLPATKLLSDDDDDENDLLLLNRSLLQAVEIGAQQKQQQSTSNRLQNYNGRDASYCARLLESKLAAWSAADGRKSQATV